MQLSFRLGPIGSGIIAGVVSALVFALLHQLLICDIWFSASFVLPAGGMCGLSIAWTYRFAHKQPMYKTWIRYNLIYFVFFIVLGLVSVSIYEPITSVMTLIQANEPPQELFSKAMPLTIIFTLSVTIVMTWLFSEKWWHAFGHFLATVVLVLLLGLNVGIIGLVFFPETTTYLVFELFALILMLVLVYAGVFLLIERKRFVKSTS